MKYPRAMTEEAQALHQRWLAQDVYEMAVGVGSIAQQCHFSREASKQVRRFIKGHCVTCGLERVASSDAYGLFAGLFCTAACPGHEPL